ncbi:MAG: DNA mismatch repair endonuclease MutL [Gemmatimonadaceae bacterium]|nr:DNA mismatch repair endonuclease MutL [Gemmatimonadaceae bacterium]
MPRIAILASAVADQIAAGEVVERPASAVKELVENAIDARAESVEVDVEDGGRVLIRVSDDGIGMDAADATLALARHATSKIREAHDLVGVASYGFRGEALPAICSVSRLTLLTATHDGEGTSVRAAGGVVEGVAPAARRRGTTIEVRDLFYNLPARRKFLRSARSEWRAIADTIVTLALTKPSLRLRVSTDGREALSLPPAASLRARVASVWGHEYAARFVEVDGVHGAVHVTGLVERPGDAGTSSRRAIVIINARAVRDIGIARGVEAAYRSTLPSGVRPSFILSITLPVDVVDVNVHPAKAEVRFHDRWGTERAVEHIVQRALGTPDAAAWVGARTWSPGSGLSPASGGALDALPVPPRPAPLDGLFAPGSEEGGDAALPGVVPGDSTDAMGVASGVGAAGAMSAAPINVPPLMQLRRTYLLYEHDEGVVLIDQHSAHERVLYERFLGALQRGEAPSQRLLFPVTLHLAPDDAEAYEASADLLSRLGYEIEAFGGHTLIVHAVPTPHARFDAIQCLRDTLAALSGAREASRHARHEQLAATVACKAAVKAGDVLAAEEMRALFLALARATLPAHDVHGRSTIVRLSWDELERRFGRR